MSWAVQVLLSAALLTGAGLVTPRTERSLEDLGRPLAAPLMLPFQWSGMLRAMRQGKPEEIVARGRMLLRLLPCWADGHFYLAHKMAFDASRRAATPDLALDRLLAALSLLDEARRLCPHHALEFLLAQAFLVELRTSDQPELGEAFRTRLGHDPLVAADTYLRRAENAASPLRVRVARAHLTKRLIGPALRDGQGAEAMRTLALAEQRLAEVEEELRQAGYAQVADNAAQHRQSLSKLGAYLRGEGDISVRSLLADPFLEDLASYLPK